MLKTLGIAWKAIAVLTLNTLVLFLIVNLLAWSILGLWAPTPSPDLDAEHVLASYPGFSEAEVRQIQRETWGRDYVYEPFTQFKEGPVAGEFVNVGQTGFRQAPEHAPWPPDPAATNVFVFGGSTTFGYGVDDVSTIPMALQQQLRGSGCSELVVYNLARSNYFSTQERILFEQQLLVGHVPSAAVFIDGLNDFIHADGKPKFSDRLTYFMSETRWQLSFRALKQTPLARLLRRLLGHNGNDPTNGSVADQEMAARAVLTRWEKNRELIRASAGTHDILTLFVWQPVPFFPRGAKVNPFLLDEAPPIPNAALLSTGYELMAGRERPDDTMWLADLTRRSEEPFYVDRVHYSASFSSTIASRIAESLAPELCSASQDT